MSFTIPQVPRFFTTASTTSIPGLRIFQNFMGHQRDEMQESALGLHQKILTCSENAPNQQTYVSKRHNLKAIKSYQPVQIQDGATIDGQHFVDYGDKGHRLTYFMGNNNIPEFVKNGLLSSVEQIPEVTELSKGTPLIWKFTFNTYTTVENSSKLAGFPFHQDIAPNGDITMIYSIGAESEFQIRLPNEPTTLQKFPLASNSLLLLSGKARWVYEHCVIPVTINAKEPLLRTTLESIWRMSLVLGCTRSDKISDRSQYV